MTLNAKFSVLHKNVWLSGGFPGGASDKEPTCQCQRYRMPGFSPWVRKIPCSREWLPTPVFLPGGFRRQRSLSGYKKSDTTEQLTLHFHLTYDSSQQFCGELLSLFIMKKVFSCGSAAKESTCSAGDLGSIPGLGRSPGGGHGKPI